MDGIVIAYDRSSRIAVVDPIAAPVASTIRVLIPRSKIDGPVIGRQVRFTPSGRNEGTFLRFVERDRNGSSSEALQTYAGVISAITPRYAVVDISSLHHLACLALTTLEQARMVATVGGRIRVTLQPGTCLVNSVLPADPQVVHDANASRLHRSLQDSRANDVHQFAGAARGETEPQDALPRDPSDPTTRVRGAAAKLTPTPNGAMVTVKKEEPEPEYCHELVIRQFAAKVGSNHGTWAVSGFDPCFFFPPSLSLRCIHDGVEMFDTTPPLLHQGAKIEIQLWSFWILDGTSVDLRVVDEDGVDVTESVARVSVVVPEAEVVLMDASSHQCVCNFEVEVLSFPMDETCEIFFEVRAEKKGLRLPSVRQQSTATTSTTGASAAAAAAAAAAALLRCGEGADRDEDFVSVVLQSRGVFVRAAPVEIGESILRDKTSLSHKFWVNNVLEPHERITSGFMDPGRSNTLLKDAITYTELNLVNSEREVIVIEECDSHLRAMLETARCYLDKIPDTVAKSTALLWFVNAAFSSKSWASPTCEANPSAPLLIPHPNAPSLAKPLPTGRRATQRQGMDSRKRRRAAAEEEYPSVVRLGSVTNGLCRHKALLYKYLADHLKIACYLVRGQHREPDEEGSGERHSWNVVVIGPGELKIADSTLFPDALRPFPDECYIGPTIARVSPPHGSDDEFIRLPNTSRPQILEECGRGASASVRRCIIGGLTCVIKVPRSETDGGLLRDEYRMLRKFNGATNIVQTFGFCRSGILLEHFPLSLLAFMNMLLVRRSCLGHSQVKQVLLAVLSALMQVHSQRCVHRDVKAENVLVHVQRCRSCLQFGTVCNECSLVHVALADFADCVQLAPPPHAASSGPDVDASAPVRIRVGTPPYAAPEIEFAVDFSYSSDLWSVGILAAEMLRMQLPSKATSPGRIELFTRGGQKANVFVPTAMPSDPGWAHDLMRGCLVVDRQARLTAGQANAALYNGSDAPPSIEKSRKK